MTLLGFVASAVFIVLAVRRLDLGAIAATWRSSHPLPWLPLGVAFYIAGHFVRGARCRVLVRPDATLALTTATNIVVTGYASNNVFPARLGELVRAGMLAERTGIPASQALVITLIERILDGVAILLLLIASAPRSGGWIHDLTWVGAAVFGIALLALFAAAHAPGAILAVGSRLSTLAPQRFRDAPVRWAMSLIRAASLLRQPRQALVLGALSLVVWLLEAGMFTAILPAFGLAPSLATGVVAMGVTNLGILVPSTPGFIGPFHFFCSRALMDQGVPLDVALSYALLVHLAFYVPVTAWGAATMAWYGVEVGTTVALARSAKRSPRAELLEGRPVLVVAAAVPHEAAPGAPPPLLRALVEATLPDDAGARAGPAVEFVHGQMSALAPRLRLLFHVGLFGFGLCALLRHGRRFTALPLAKRRAYAERWAFGRIALGRKLMRPVRATALLAYYEHEAVAQGGDVILLRGAKS